MLMSHTPSILYPPPPADVDAPPTLTITPTHPFEQGPNYAWHCDGYDKLKPFGIAIQGCIDGYVLSHV